MTGGGAMSDGVIRPRELIAGDPAAMAGAVAAQFAERHGRPPDGVWRAPGRVNLMGEHTDYNGGRCLPIGLDHATYAAIGRRDDDRVTAESLEAPGIFAGTLAGLSPTSINGWHAYCVGVVWAARENGILGPGVDIVVSSTVPIGAGVSSSASLECAVAIGLAELTGLELDDDTRRRLIRVCTQTETTVAGAPTGGLDQTASMFAATGCALAIDFADGVDGGPGSVARVEWVPEAHGLELIVVDTGVSHELTDGGYATRRAQCEDAAAQLGFTSLSSAAAEDVELLGDDLLRRRARHVLSENQRVSDVIDALGAGRWVEVGERMNESHRSLRDDFEVSCVELDIACDVAVAHGALGARMTGGGFGGSMIALVPIDAIDTVPASIAADFDRRGRTGPAVLRSRAASGAGRVEIVLPGEGR